MWSCLKYQKNTENIYSEVREKFQISFLQPVYCILIPIDITESYVLGCVQ